MKKLIFWFGNIIIPKRYKKTLSILYHKTRSLILRGSTDFFIEVAIETNTKCNRRCPYCPNSKFGRGLKNKLMSEKLFHKIIDELHDIKYSGRIVLSFFNEPLLDPRIERLISFAKKKLKDSQIVIFTNGDYLNKKKFKDLINAGVTNFLITQHGKIINPKLDKFLKELSSKEKKFIDFKKLTKESKLSNRGGEIKIKNLDNRNKKRCFLPSNIVQVDYKGNVILCCNDYHSSTKFGNLNKEKLINIWNKEEFKKLRRNNKRGIYNLEICRKCRGLYS